MYDMYVFICTTLDHVMVKVQINLLTYLLTNNKIEMKQEISLKDKCRRFVFSLQLFLRNNEK